MFIRFVVTRLDPDSGRRQGLFQAAHDLRQSGIMDRTDFERLESIRLWFAENLAKPNRLALSTKPHSKAQAISWFKDGAIEHTNKMREFQQVLQRNGLGVETLRTDRPGYVVYEDDYQVAAYPFSDTPA
jgi:hypothetical protein